MTQLRRWWWIPALLGGGIALGLGLVPLLLNGETFRQPLQSELSKILQRPVTFDELQVQANGLTARQVRVEEQTAEQIFVEVDLWALLAQRIEIKQINVEKARLSLRRDDQGNWALPTLPSSNASGGYSGPGVRLTDSTVVLIDQAKKQQLTIQKVSFTLNPQTPSNLDLMFKGEIAPQTKLALDGNLQLSTASPTSDLTLTAERLQPQMIVNYLGKIPILEGFSGDMDLKARWQAARITALLKARRLDWRGRWQAQDVTLDTQFILKTQQIALEKLQITGKDLDLTVKGILPRVAQPTSVLDLTVKTASLDPFQARKSLPIGFLNPEAQRLVSQSQGTGQIQADLRVQGTVGQPRFTGTAVLKDFTLTRAGLPRYQGFSKLKNLSGQVGFDPQRLTLTGLQGQLGASQFTLAGTVEAYRSANPRPQLSIQSNSLDLAAAQALLPKNFLPVRFLTGTAAVDLQQSGSRTEGRVELQGVAVEIPNLREPWKDLEGVLTLKGGGIGFTNLKGQFADAPLSLTGQVAPGGALQLQGQGALAFPQILALLPPLPGLSVAGETPLSFTIQGTVRQWNLTGDLDLSRLTKLQVQKVNLAPARRLVFRGTLSPTQFTLAPTRLTLANFAVDLQGVFRGPKTQLTARTVQPVSLQTLRGFIPELAQSPVTGGQARVAVSLNGSTVQTRLDLQGVALPSLLGGMRGLAGPVTVTSTQASSPGLTFQTPEGNGLLKGTLRGSQFTFELRLARLNLDTAARGEQGGTGKGTDLGKLRGQGRLLIDQGTLSRLPFQQLQTQLTLNQGELMLRDLQLNSAGGQMTGNLTTNLQTQAITGDMVLRSMEADTLAQQLLGFPAGQIYGQTNLNINFQGKGSSLEQFLGSLDGQGTLNITNGRLANADLLGPMLIAAGDVGRGFSVDTLLGAIGQMNTGRFQRLGGDFTLKNGVADTDNFSYVASGLNMQASGTLRLVDRRADLAVQGRFTQSLGSGTSGLIQGLLGGLLGRGAAVAQPRNFRFQVQGPINRLSSVRGFQFN